jgi:predicted anti-sigma-YlaC factor YlaD
MERCEEIEAMLLDYINRNLSREENSKVIVHLSRCENCRRETAELLNIKRQLTLQAADVPDEILRSAYDKIPRKEKNLDDILSSNSPFMAIDLIRYTMEPVRKTIQLALQGL